MPNLNDLIAMQTQWNFPGYNIDAELILGEQEFPQIDEDTFTDYRKAFFQLYLEVIDARPRPTKVRITSKLEQGLQKVWIEHNGSLLDNLTLDVLNLRIEKVEKGEQTYTTPGKHGNLIAAHILKAYGGRIRLSNINDGEYHVQTRVEIPIPPS